MEGDEKKLKVLIVDDDNFLLNIYSVRFEKHGCDVSVATSIEKALEILKDGFEPDILMLDLVMRGTSGMELLKDMRKEKLADDATVIILSNASPKEKMEEAGELGVDGYILKASSTPSEVLEEVMDIYKEHKK